MKTRRASKKTVVLRFEGSLRAASGKTKVSLQFDESLQLGSFIRGLCKQIPELSGVLDQSDSCKVTSNVLILVNGREISALNGLDTIVEQGDEIVFVPVVHGG